MKESGGKTRADRVTRKEQGMSDTCLIMATGTLFGAGSAQFSFPCSCAARKPQECRKHDQWLVVL
jgi:hypothetical protein